MVLNLFVLYVLLVCVYLILTPKAASPPALDEGAKDEINEEVYSPASSATSDSDSVQEKLLEPSESRYSDHISVYGRRSYSQATRHRW